MKFKEYTITLQESNEDLRKKQATILGLKHIGYGKWKSNQGKIYVWDDTKSDYVESINKNKSAKLMEINRAEVVKEVGEDLIKKVERQNCEPTGRVGFNGKMQGNSHIEWVAWAENSTHRVALYYLVPQSVIDRHEDDLGVVDWGKYKSGYKVTDI